MQIPSIPPPIITSALPQDVAAKAAPNMQAAMPMTINAVPPSPKSEKSNQTRSNGDRSRGGKGGGKDGKEGKGERGSSVNIRV